MPSSRLAGRTWAARSPGAGRWLHVQPLRAADHGTACWAGRAVEVPSAQLFTGWAGLARRRGWPASAPRPNPRPPQMVRGTGCGRSRGSRRGGHPGRGPGGVPCCRRAPAHLQSLGDPPGQAAVPAEPAVKKPRLADGVARLWAAAAVVPGPLAAAAGPEERTRLKRAADRQGEGAAHAAEPTEASSHCGRNRTLPIDLAGDWPLGGPKCPLGGPKCEGRAAGSSVVAGAVPFLAWESVQLVPVQPVLVQPVQLEPGPGPAAQPLSRAKRARFISEAQSRPPALCWQPYVGHGPPPRAEWSVVHAMFHPANWRLQGLAERAVLG